MSFGDKHVLSEASSVSRRVVEGGGEIVAEGTPEQVAKESRSHTGTYLAPLLTHAVRVERSRDTRSSEAENFVRQSAASASERRLNKARRPVLSQVEGVP